MWIDGVAGSFVIRQRDSQIVESLLVDFAWSYENVIDARRRVAPARCHEE